VKIIIAKATNNKKNPYVYLQKSLLESIGKGEILSENEAHIFQMNPISSNEKANDLFFECFYWLRKVSTFADESYSKDYLIDKRIFNILMLLLLNIDDLNEDILPEIKSVLKDIDTFKDFYENIEDPNVFQRLFNLETLSLNDLKLLRKDFLIKNHEGKLNLFVKCYENVDEVMKIKVATKTTEEINGNYEKADKQWLKQYARLSERILARNRIFRYFKKYQLNFKKLLKNRRVSTIVSYNLMEFLSKDNISDKDSLNVKRFLLKHKFVLDFYESIHQLSVLTMTTYYLNIIDNGLDFHYLLSVLNEIQRKREKFEKAVLLHSDPKIIGKEMVQEFVDLKYEMSDLRKNLEKWIENNHSPKITEVKLQQSKKSIALKFAKRHLYRTANKIFNLKSGKVKK